MLARLVFISLALSAFALVGCGINTDHNVHGRQTHEHNVHHDPQRLDIYIHRDRRRQPNPSPPQEVIQ